MMKRRPALKTDNLVKTGYKRDNLKTDDQKTGSFRTDDPKNDNPKNDDPKNDDSRRPALRIRHSRMSMAAVGLMLMLALCFVPLPGRGNGLAGTLMDAFLVRDVQASEQQSLSKPKLYGRVRSGKTILLSWAAAPDADGFELFKYVGGSYVKYLVFPSNEAASFSEEGSLDSQYSYKLRSYKWLSNGKKLCSSYSSVIVMKTAISQKPTITVGQALSATRIAIKWTTVPLAEKYEIWRDGGGGSFELLDTVTADTDSRQIYTDNTARFGETYRYRVRAVRRNYSGNVYGTFSNIRTVTPYIHSGGQTSSGRKLLFVGDSRTEMLEMYLKNYWGGNSRISFISQSGAGYPYLSSVAGSILNGLDGNTDLLLWFGVNDPYNVGRYISFYLGQKPLWEGRGAKVYVMNPGPLEYSPYVDNSEVEAFNRRLSAELTGVTVLDVYSYLVNTGYSTLDGVHYTNATSRKVYDYAMGLLGMK